MCGEEFLPLDLRNLIRPFARHRPDKLDAGRLLQRLVDPVVKAVGRRQARYAGNQQYIALTANPVE